MNDMNGISPGLSNGMLASSLKQQAMGAQIINGTLSQMGGGAVAGPQSDGGMQLHTAQINAAVGKGTEIDVAV